MNRVLVKVVISLSIGCASWSHSRGADPAPAAKGTAVSELTLETTALCKDDTWSSSQNKSGACSQHGGIKTWFGKAPKKATARCKDGTYSKSASQQGACSSHGGVAFELPVKAKK